MILKTKFKGLFIFKNKNFKDKRGYFREIIRENKLIKKFPFLVMSFSKQNVVRGLHIQTKNSQGKFVTVIKGKIFDVAVDLRKNSKTFGKHFKIDPFKTETNFPCFFLVCICRPLKTFFFDLDVHEKIKLEPLKNNRLKSSLK